jgi:uncharacterized protein YdhG (YjbR/CyaY superfamily)
MSRIDTYLKALSPENRAVLQHIRELVHKHVPDAGETFSYNMPAMTYQGKPLIYYAAFRDHLSIFPTSFPIEALQDQLKPYKVSKGTIQFTVNNPLPDTLIHTLLSTRIDEIEKGKQS